MLGWVGFVDVELCCLVLVYVTLGSVGRFS